MPKLKSKGAVKKRFRITKSGKVKASRPRRGHMHAPKDGAARRELRKPLIVGGAWAALLRRMMRG